MKRSEMIKLIKDYLTGLTQLTDEDNNLAATQLLTYIEDAGMSPPEADILRSRTVDNLEITWFKKAKEWEKE